MVNHRIAYRYALSLFTEASQQKVVTKVYADMIALQEMLSASRELRYIFLSSIISAENKIAIWQQIAHKHFLPVSYGFVKMVITKRREPLIQAIISKFSTIYKKQNAIEEIEIVSASSLDKAQVTLIKNKLSKNKQVQFTEHIEEDLIGGFILKWSNQVLDLSLRHRLTSVKQKLLEK